MGEKLREELHQLRVAQVSGGSPAKVLQIRGVHKNIARLLTIITQITKQKVRAEYKRQGKTLLPLDLRPKTTKAKRNALPKHLAKKKTPKERRLTKKYPQRKFAVINRHCVLPQAVVKMNVKHALSGKKDSRYSHYLVRKQHTYTYKKRIRIKYYLL